VADLPIACELTPDALETRRAGLLTELAGRAEAREAMPDGYRLRFARRATPWP